MYERFTAQTLALLIAAALLNGCAAQVASAGDCCALAEPKKTEAKPTSPPVTAEDWLDLIEKETASIKTLHAKVRYDCVQELQGDEQRRFGTLVFVAGPPARFAVHFHVMIEGETPRKLDDWFIFDGKWLVERYNLAKKFIKTQVVSPDADAERTDPLALGAGPFAVPLGAKKEVILKRFNVKLAKPEEDDPPDTVHLSLVAKAGRDIEFENIDLWYNRKTLIPVRAAARQTGSEEEHVYHLTKVQLDDEVKPGEIDTSEPKGRGWHVEIAPWKEPAKKPG